VVVWVEDGRPIRYLVENLSVGGALLTGGPPLEAGRKVRIALEFGGKPALMARATVAHHRMADGELPAMGMAFHELGPNDEDSIHQAILDALDADARGGDCPRNVLVVDDCAKTCELLRRDLGAIGHAAVSARTCLDAIVRTRDTYAHFDVALIDLFLGVNDGVELLDYFREHHPTTRRVLMSGKVTAGQLGLAHWMGRANAVLTKPWNQRTLLAAVGT
jgi:CheY-like chemotaxis protein